MKPPLRLLALALLPFGVIHAQDASRVTNTADTANLRREAGAPLKSEKERPTAVPSLYEGEFEDVGPQMLLLERPPHDWFQVLADLQSYYTSNATLVESPRTWSDVTVLTAQAGVNARPIGIGAGKLAFNGGYRYQKFAYGWLSGRTNHDIAGGAGKLDALDFDTHTGYLNAEWSQDGWFAGTGARYSAYIANPTDKTTYQEWVPSVHAGRRFNLSDADFLSVDVDAAYRISHTHLPSFVGDVVGYDLNDRYDLGLNVSYLHAFGSHFFIQPAYRFQYSGYTQGGSTADEGAGRDDFLHIVSLTFGYYHSENFSVRLFGSAEVRDSSEATVADYRNYNAGLGVTASLTF